MFGRIRSAPRCSARRRRRRCPCTHLTREQTAAAEVARIAATLRPDGAVRLERLRGFGAGMGRLVTCACSRVTLADGSSAVLIAALERGGPDLSLAQRVSRLLAACVEPVAVFGDDGALIGATPTARRLIGDRTSLDALDAGPIAIDCLRDQTVSIVTFGEGHGQRAANEATAATTAVARPKPVAAALPDPVPAPEQPQPPPEPPPHQAEAPHDKPVAAQPELFPELAAETRTPLPAAPAEWRHPLRFVWQMDAGRPLHHRLGRIDRGHGTADRRAAPAALAVHRIGDELDPDGQVARAIATRDTWSGVARCTGRSTAATAARRWSCRACRYSIASARSAAIAASACAATSPASTPSCRRAARRRAPSRPRPRARRRPCCRRRSTRRA